MNGNYFWLLLMVVIVAGMFGDILSLLGHRLRFASRSQAGSVRREPATQLVVRDIEGATLMVRTDPLQNSGAAHLIVWDGKEGRQYLDLGSRPTVGDEMVEEFVAIAAERLKQISSRESVPPPVPTPEEIPAGKPEAPAESAIKLRKTPSVTRGVILEVGVMSRVIGEKQIEQFGLRYRSVEGVEDICWGVDLKRALKEAKASVGDKVEILKMGRKTVEEGRAPMTLWQITKIE